MSMDSATEKRRNLQEEVKEIEDFFSEQYIPCSKEQAEGILKFEMNSSVKKDIR